MATTDIMGLFKIMLIVQLFFSFGITIIAYTIPGESIDYVTSFSDLAGEINVTSVGEQVSGSLQQQTNIPVIELGALVFYSGNILIDLLLNFAFAIPQMIGLLVYGITHIFNLPTFLVASIEGFSAVVVLVLYFLSIIQLLTGIRSGRIV